MTQRRALQTRILKMENYEICWLHHCICKVEKTESSRMPVATVKPAALSQERGGSAKRIQADSRKSLMSSSCQEPSAPGKLAALFSLGSEEAENQFKSSVLKNADPSIWEDLFLKAKKIICSVRQGLKLWSKNTKLNLSIIASVSCSNKLMLKDWNYRTLNTDGYMLNLDENRFVYKKNYRWRKGFSEILKSEVCTKWEKWKELKNYELTKSQCKNEEKIMRQYRSSLLSCKRCKNRWILWMIQKEFHGIKLQWEIVLRFQSTCNDPKLSFHAEQRQTPAFWHMEYIGITRKRFW